MENANTGIAKAPGTSRSGSKRCKIEVLSMPGASSIGLGNCIRTQRRTAVHDIRIRLVERPADAGCQPRTGLEQRDACQVPAAEQHVSHTAAVQELASPTHG